jgi:hypothetical protein
MTLSKMTLSLMTFGVTIKMTLTMPLLVILINALPIIIRLLKMLSCDSNALAYFAMPSVTKGEKSFITLLPIRISNRVKRLVETRPNIFLFEHLIFVYF